MSTRRANLSSQSPQALSVSYSIRVVLNHQRNCVMLLGSACCQFGGAYYLSIDMPVHPSWIRQPNFTPRNQTLRHHLFPRRRHIRQSEIINSPRMVRIDIYMNGASGRTASGDPKDFGHFLGVGGGRKTTTPSSHGVLALHAR